MSLEPLRSKAIEGLIEIHRKTSNPLTYEEVFQNDPLKWDAVHESLTAEGLFFDVSDKEGLVQIGLRVQGEIEYVREKFVHLLLTPAERMKIRRTILAEKISALTTLQRNDQALCERAEEKMKRIKAAAAKSRPFDIAGWITTKFHFLRGAREPSQDHGSEFVDLTEQLHPFIAEEQASITAEITRLTNLMEENRMQPLL